MACSSSPSLPPKLRILPSGRSCRSSGTALQTGAAGIVPLHPSNHLRSAKLYEQKGIGPTRTCRLGVSASRGSQSEQQITNEVVHAHGADRCQLSKHPSAGFAWWCRQCTWAG